MKLFSGLNNFKDLGLLALRLGIGIIFIKHGLFKWQMWGMQPSDQMPASMLTLFKILSVAEPLGGLSMIAGFLTPLAAIGMSVLMVGVINMKINVMHVGFIAGQTTGWELDFLVLCSALCLLFTGPGKISLERFVSRE